MSRNRRTHWKVAWIGMALCLLLCSCTVRKSLMTKSGGRPFEVAVYGDEDSVLYHSLIR